MEKPSRIARIISALPIFATVAGATFVVARHRISPYPEATLLAWLLTLVALLAIGELTQRYVLLESIERRLTSLSSLSAAIASGHLGALFLKKRAQFPPFEERVRHAREVSILGISLQGLVSYHSGVFARKISEGALVRFIIMDPSSAACEAKACGLFSATEPGVLKSHIEHTISTIDHLREGDGGNLRLRLTPHVPSVGIVMIDPAQADGVIIVELYPYLVTSSDRAHFELVPSDGVWYEHFRNQFEAIWNDADER